MKDDQSPLDATPVVIGRFMDAADRRDYDGIVACFNPAATVTDEGRTHKGREAIRAWQEETRRRWDYTVTVLSSEPSGPDSQLLSVRLQGNFPGGTAETHYRFTLRGGLIDRLDIG